jgi:hypothetical protein
VTSTYLAEKPETRTGFASQRGKGVKSKPICRTPTKLSATAVDEAHCKLNTLIEEKRYRKIEAHLSPSDGVSFP